jgi:hypothetical protein
MDRRRHRSPSLAERTRGRTAANGPAPGRPGPTRQGDDGSGGASASPRRHCWVVDAVQPDARAPGLLVEWRQLGGAWQGRVAYVVAVDGDPTLVEAWVPASQLERADDT